jgi:hypothetical protein
VVRRSASGRRLSTLKSKRMQLQFIDEDVEDAHWVVLCDVVIQTLGSSVTWLRSSASMIASCGWPLSSHR